MMRQDVKYVAGVVLVVAAVTSFLSLSGRDVRFCRRVFTKLASGDPSVRHAIAWGELKALGTDVGATYASLANRQVQTAYEQAFIRSFAEGFQQGGAAVQAFTNWRREAPGTVAVDYPAKHQTLLFHLTRKGMRRVAAVEWRQG